MARTNFSDCSLRIVFDINTPAPLPRWLRGHEVTLGIDLGWKGLENGKLLDTAEVVVLSTNRWPSIRPVVARIAALVDFVRCGQVTRIEVQKL